MSLQQWKSLFESVQKDWMESVQLVFDYFCERTPRSFVEARETSMVWNYKHAGKGNLVWLVSQVFDWHCQASKQVPQARGILGALCFSAMPKLTLSGIAE